MLKNLLRTLLYYLHNPSVASRADLSHITSAMPASLLLIRDYMRIICLLACFPSGQQGLRGALLSLQCLDYSVTKESSVKWN